jgi:hypothetical protein
MRGHSFSAIDDLIRRAEQAAAAKPDQIRLVAELVSLVGDRGADPYLLIGALVEGAVNTLATHIPPERQSETTEQLGRLLVERLRAHGLA